MFGELDDSDIYENNQGGGFGGSSDSNSDFSFGDSTTGGSSSDDGFLDLDSFGESSSDGFLDNSQNDSFLQDDNGYSGFADPAQNMGAAQAEPQQNSANDSLFADEQMDFGGEDGVLGAGAPNQSAAQVGMDAPQPNAQQPKKQNGSIIYIALLLVLALAAGGMFMYKNNMIPGLAPAQENSEAQDFFDKVTQEGAQNPSGEATATVDVDLAQAPAPAEGAAPQPSDAASVAAQPEDPAAAIAQDGEVLGKDGKPLNAIEKAMLKKKQDESKEKQLGLGTNPVIIPVNAGGRPDPFLPYTQIQQEKMAKSLAFDIIAPPTTVPSEDPVVDQVVQTKISGIMYDSSRPSAIINVGGADQLVHKGDTFKDCKVLDITRNSVVIKYKNNVYQATVGQTLGEGVNLNPVSNLSKQFGGLYSKSGNNVIEFNN